ncbi:winged helix-turn-helix domain-containing protein [Saccharopolyspora shandongensis]|uniref:winged helix-turn-helix domain-containing protein n=1 Tax=Saccharopolyspora shandongensis TaxID=418495 RepID=UPI0033E7519F
MRYRPVQPHELVLRAQELLRRCADMPTAAPRFQVEDLAFDTTTRQITKAGKKLRFTSRERDLLEFFFANPGTTFRKNELMQKVWQWQVGDPSVVCVYISRLRKKIETDPGNPTILTTVWGTGYRLGPARAGQG